MNCFNLNTLKNIKREKTMKKNLIINKKYFLEWMYLDHEEKVALANKVIENLLNGKIFQMQDIISEIAYFPKYMIINPEDFEDELTEYDELFFEQNKHYLIFR